jgi:hypothetical protein
MSDDDDDFTINTEYGKDEDEDEDEDKILEQKEEDEPTLVAGVTQYKQMGTNNTLYQDDLGGLESRKRFRLFGNISGEDRFRKMANYYIQTTLKGKLDPNEISPYINKIKKIEYKNPKAFILGYLFMINKEDIRKVEGYIDQDVSKEDIIRYYYYIKNIII